MRGKGNKQGERCIRRGRDKGYNKILPPSSNNLKNIGGNSVPFHLPINTLHILAERIIPLSRSTLSGPKWRCFTHRPIHFQCSITTVTQLMNDRSLFWLTKSLKRGITTNNIGWLVPANSHGRTSWYSLLFFLFHLSSPPQFLSPAALIKRKRMRRRRYYQDINHHGRSSTARTSDHQSALNADNSRRWATGHRHSRYTHTA